MGKTTVISSSVFQLQALEISLYVYKMLVTYKDDGGFNYSQTLQFLRHGSMLPLQSDKLYGYAHGCQPAGTRFSVDICKLELQ